MRYIYVGLLLEEAALRNKAKAVTAKKVEEITTDVVVVGGGASGSAAALAAAEKGVKVVMLEKAAGVSGAGTMAGVLFADHSSLQIAAGKEVDSAWIYDQYTMDSKYNSNSRLVSAIIKKSSSTVDWLMKNGVKLALLDAGQGAQYNHVGMPATAHGYVDGGAVALKTIHENVKSLGGQVMYETPGESLIKDTNGKVIGVVAAKLINAPNLVEEVANYNKMAKSGKDTQFYKDSKFMNPVSQAPYYAVITKLRCLGTLGGVAINEDIQSIDQKGKPIDNLWVTGADAGGMYGNSYVMFEGATLGFAYNSGRIAGENAAANAGK